jgi:hypothetical protein
MMHLHDEVQKQQLGAEIFSTAVHGALRNAPRTKSGNGRSAAARSSRKPTRKIGYLLTCRAGPISLGPARRRPTLLLENGVEAGGLNPCSAPLKRWRACLEGTTLYVLGRVGYASYAPSGLR